MRRREFLAGVASLALPLRASAAQSFELGVCSYSLEKLARADAIKAVAALGTPNVNIKSFHLPYETNAEERSAARAEFESAGLRITGGGTIYLEEESDEHVRFHFDYARECGMPLMVIGTTAANLPRIERFVKEYDIKVAVHNHGPEDAHFPGPQDVLPHIRNMDPRVGVCIDVGHTARTGVDVVEAIDDAGDRFLDMHMKDLRDLMVKESQCIVGEGAMPLEGIFKQLNAMGYTGYVNLEYEIDADDPLPGMKTSFTNMRRTLARL